MLSDSLVDSFRARLAPLGLDLADLKIGGTSHRPLVQVRIEWDAPSQRVTVDDCATASRALEAWLDADGPLGHRYILEVSSPGLERPLRWHRHWVRFVGHGRRTGAGAGPHRGRTRRGDRRAPAGRCGAATRAVDRYSRRAFGRGLVIRGTHDDEYK